MTTLKPKPKQLRGTVVLSNHPPDLHLLCSTFILQAAITI